MAVDWDERKNRINERKHGVSFERAAGVFDDPHAVSFLERVVDDEERWHTIGMSGDSVVILLVAHTVEEQNGEEEIRIISARKASSRERALYPPYQ